jgi:alcohol-forming fatty acyl-CoA reductase
MESQESIQEFYKNKSILITGVTGFLGKVILEKFLRDIPEIKKIYLIVRKNKKMSVKERVTKEIFNSPIMGRLKEKHGKNFKNFFDEKV